jgi:VWFA-related protein
MCKIPRPKPHKTWQSLILGFCLILASVVFSADKDQKKEPEKSQKDGEKPPSFTVKVPVDVVVLNATITDKQGNPVKDLTVDDFKVYEDGKPQPIHTFALESYKATQITDKTGKVISPDGTTTQEEASQARLISLVIDDITVSSQEMNVRTIDAMRKFVEQDLGPGDQVAILSASGRVQFPFISDKAQLLDQVNGLHQKLDRGPISRNDCPEMPESQAMDIVEDRPGNRALQVAVTEMNICENRRTTDVPEQMMIARVRALASGQHEEIQYRNRLLLGTLRQHLRSLRHFEAKKSLILFSDGFIPDQLRYELQEVVDLALRVGAIFNTIDARGLYTTNYGAKDRVTVGNTVETSTILAQKPLIRSEDMRRQEEPLEQLAHETGGIFFHNNNDLGAGLGQIINNQSFYYVLTYATPSPKADGRYHKVKLEISRPGLQVTYRKGYYAPKEQLTFERRKKEDIMEALQAPGNLNEIPIQLSYNYFQVDEARYQIALLTKVNIQGLQFLEEDARHKNLFNLIVVAFDEHDTYVDGLEKSMELNLTDPSYAAMLNYGFTSKVDIKVSPGRYKIRAVVREGNRTKMGSVRKTIEVP